MKKGIVLLIGLILMIGFANAQSKKGKGRKLDKKTYVCDFLQSGGKDAFQDELKFVNGQFLCGIMQDDGFRATEYEATIDSAGGDAPTITFTCSAKNDKGDEYLWTGKVTGDDMTGTGCLVNKKGKTKKSYTFSGTLKLKKGKGDNK